MRLTGFITVLFLVVFIVLTGCRVVEQEIHLIPEGYSGWVVVLYEQEDGYIPKYQDEHGLFIHKATRVLHIPKSGLLKTRDKYFFVPREYYFHNNSGDLVPLSEAIDIKLPSYQTNTQIWMVNTVLPEEDNGVVPCSAVFYAVGTSPQLTELETSRALLERICPGP